MSDSHLNSYVASVSMLTTYHLENDNYLDNISHGVISENSDAKVISGNFIVESKMADLSFAPKREFPPEFRAKSNRIVDPTQRMRERAERLPPNPVATGILQSDATRWLSKATKWPTQSLPEKLCQTKLFISQKGSHTYFLSNSNLDIRFEKPFNEFLEDINITVPSRMFAELLETNYKFLRKKNLKEASSDISLMLIELLQISYLKTNKVIQCCTNTTQAVVCYSELNKEAK